MRLLLKVLEITILVPAIWTCVHQSWHPRITWQRPKYIQELAKALSCHLTKQCIESATKNSLIFVAESSKCLPWLRAGFFFLLYKGRFPWEADDTEFLFFPWFWSQWITFQMKSSILVRLSLGLWHWVFWYFRVYSVWIYLCQLAQVWVDACSKLYEYTQEMEVFHHHLSRQSATQFFWRSDWDL